jgi:hypothetical protein
MYIAFINQYFVAWSFSRQSLGAEIGSFMKVEVRKELPYEISCIH